MSTSFQSRSLPAGWARFAIAIGLFLFACAATARAQSGTTTTLSITSAGVPVTTIRQSTQVTLTATVTAASGSPVSPGQVEFCEVKPSPTRCTDIRLLATVQLSSAGTAVYKLFPGPGTHTYQAIFLGTHAVPPGSSASAVLTVNPYYATTTTLIAGPQSASGYTLTATVTGTQGSTPPTGTVTFEDASNGNYVLGTATLVPGAPGTPTGLGFATSQVVGSAPTMTLTALVADLNGDGKPDLVLGTETDYLFGVFFNTVQVFLGNGDGTFTATPAIPVYLSEIALAVGDFNGDGKPDLVAFGVTPQVGFAGVPANEVQILLGNGDGTFTVGQALPNPDFNQPYPALNPPQVPGNPPLPNMANPTVAVGDINGDGIADIVFSTGVNATVAVFFGKGDGTFTAGPTTPAGIIADGIALADYNGDGKLDVAVTQSTINPPTSNVTLLLGRGDGTFTTANPIQGVSTSTSAIVAADFDRDGILDVATESWAGEIDIFLGKGDGTFTSHGTIGPTASSGSVLAVGDFNGDGIPDLITASGSTQLSVSLGNGDGIFQPQIGVNVPPFQFPTAISSVALGDFNGSGLSGIASADYANYEAAVLLPQAAPQTTSSTTSLSNIIIAGTGTHQIIAIYSGDSTYQPSTSAPLPLDATGQPTSVTLSLNPTSINYGQPVVMTATITPAAVEGHTVGGSITFKVASNTLATVPVVNGVATFTSTLLPIGTDTVAAIYSGDTNFASSGGSAVEVVSGFNSTSTLTSTPNPSYFGQTVTLTAAVAGVSSTVIAAGTVTFYDSATIIGHGTLDATGHATMTTSTLALGLHDLSFVYSGDLGFFASTSPTVMQIVNAQGSGVTLAASPNPAGFGQPVTLTSAVTLSNSGTATGVVNFFDGATQIAQATLDPTGHATFTTSSLALGTHTLTAVFPGTAGIGGSTSLAVQEVIENLGFTLTLSNPGIPLQTYRHTTTAVTLTSLGNFADSITLACVNPPQYVTCQFTPQPATLTGNATNTVSFYLDTDSILGLGGSARNRPPRSPWPSPLTTLALLLSPFSLAGAFATRRSSHSSRRSLRILILIATCAALTAGLSGCGSSIITPVPHAAPGTYNIPITATATTSGLTHTATLTLTITP